MRSLVLLPVLLVPASAFAAGGETGGPSPELLFAQIIILIFCGRLLGELMQRIGQPAVIGQLVAGLLLGPSFFGWLWPDAQHAIFPKAIEQRAMLDAIAQVGILLLLLLTGMETDLKLVRKIGKPAISVSLTGIVVPFLCGFALGQFLPDSLLPHPEARLITSLFLGTALSISSVKIVAMVVREMHFMRRNVGQIVVSAAITDDTIGWIIIAITFSLAESGRIEIGSLAKSVLGTVAFLVFSLTLGRRIVFSLIRWANDNFVSEVPVISTIFVIMGVMALITSEIGVHSVLGAFMAGILVGESPILTRKIDGQLRGMITGVFAPVFFGLAGLSADLTMLNNSTLIWLTIGLILIASIGKFGGAFLGGRIGGLTGRESMALASGMNARGSTEVIVATIGLSLGMLSESLFTMIVTMAVVTTMAMPPMLRWALARLPLGEEEKQRLEREEYEARGFVTNLERLLLAVDDSDNGKFATRLTGFLAGSRGLPTTVFQLGKQGQGEDRDEHAKTTARAVEAAAKKAGKARKASKDEDAPREVDVTTRTQKSPTQKAIEDEAKKGYDLLMIGIRNTLTSEGAIRNEIGRIAAGFSGPLALATARGKHEERPLTAPLNIMVAIAGTGLSSRAAEVAVVIARASNARISALYVSDAAPGPGETRRLAKPVSRSHQREEAILKDTVEMAERHGVALHTAVRVDAEADQAILHYVKSGGYDLIVMGVSRRSGDKLFFGNTAQAVLEKAQCSVLLLAADSLPAGNAPGPKAEAS